MSIERTAANLAAFCLQVVGAPYWFACFGNVASESLYNSKRSESQNKKYYDSWPKSTFTDDYGKRVTDCAGLPKWFLWSDSMEHKAPTYKASEDYGATGFWNKCTENGPLSTIPQKKTGLLVFKGTGATKSHVGVVVDDAGTVVEAKGHAYGTIKSNITSFDCWGKCHLIKYDDAPAPEPPKDVYTVTTKYEPLKIRKEPTTKSEEIGKLAKGSTIISTHIVEGEDIHGCTAWAEIDGGYASGYYLSPTPSVEPSPEPPTPQTGEYEVKTHSGAPLALRVAPNRSAALITWIPNGSKVQVSTFAEGQTIGTNNLWARATYKGMTGYCSAAYLVKI